MKFGTNSGIFCLFPHFSGTIYENLETFHHFLRISVKFWQNSTEISQKNDQIHRPKSEWNEISFHSGQKVWRFFLEFWGVSGAKAKKSCRARKILKNACFLAIVAVDTAENEPLKVWAVSFHYFNPILNQSCFQKWKLRCLLLQRVNSLWARQRNRKLWWHLRTSGCLPPVLASSA